MKEVLLLFMVVLSAFVLIEFNEPTGLVVNSMAEFRTQRVNLYFAFPQPLQYGVHRILAQRAREHLRLGAHEDHYRYNGLQFGHRFFDNEHVLVDTLLVLACEKEATEFIPQRTLNDRVTVSSVGVVPCDHTLQGAATDTLGKLTELDYDLVAYTVQQSNCAAEAGDSLARARQNIDAQLYEASITNLRNAWSTTLYCI